MTTPVNKFHLTQRQLLHELEPVVAQNLDRHTAFAVNWDPRDYIPDACENDAPTLTASARSAMITSLLTEDNLPSYYRDIADTFPPGSPWSTWIRTWRAEESQHADVLHDYLVATGSVNADALKHARMQHMSVGIESTLEGSNLLHSLAHSTIQEFMTKVYHLNNQVVCGDPVAHRILERIAADEQLHTVFYRNLCDAALDLAPDQTARAIGDVVMNFPIPGAARRDTRRRTTSVPVQPVYDFDRHLNDVLVPLLDQWNFFHRTDFGPDGELIRDRLGVFLEYLGRNAARTPHPRPTGSGLSVG
ncbi:MAG: acyl-ACP desaturase [Rhodococcus sp.]|nr:acyl-ACP desaturase [Rhodococcus sp. (in: high G+C Gram-positive bacteria)]